MKPAMNGILAVLCLWASAGWAVAGEESAGTPEIVDVQPEVAAEGRSARPSPAAALERARAFKRLKQDLVTSIEHKGRTQEIQGRMWKDGERVRFELSLPTPNGPMIQLAVFDGRMFTTHLPEPINVANQVDFSEVEKRVEPRRWALFNRARALAVESDPFLGMDTGTLAFQRFDELDGLAVHVFEADMEPIPEDFRGGFPYVAARAEIWLAVEDGMPRRVTHFTEGGIPILTHTFRNVVIDPPLDDGLFTLTFAKNVKVDDTTKQVVQKLVE